jgi:methyl-accepting chemotaxis protein
MVSTGINYRDTYFEFPELTKLQGEPTSESLYLLRNELKANAQSVYSNLSDGVHGHLALVLSAAQYALITPTAFVRRVHPGVLAIPVGTTAPMATVLKEAHHEQLRLFREVQGVEKALIQQLVQAIGATYLSSIRDRATNSLQGTVYEIIDHLQTVYGRVSPQMLEDREQELRNMVYNTQQPIDVVFNAVEDFADFADLGHQPLTPRQTISKAYVILNKTRRFKTDITDWNRRPDVDKTWPNFKEHFRRAHQEFRETTDITLEESDLHRNNANLVQQVVDGMQQAMAADNSGDETAAMLQQMTNSATQSSEANQQLQAQLQQMQQAMSMLQTQVNHQGHNSIPPQGFNQQQQQQQYTTPFQFQVGRAPPGPGYQGRGGRGRGPGRGGGRGNPSRVRNNSIYCWTHGGCGHASAACLAKLNGHQDGATFQNKLGGNTRNCPP